MNIAVDEADDWDHDKANWDDSSEDEASGEEYGSLMEKKKGPKVGKIDKLVKKREKRAAAAAGGAGAEEDTAMSAEERARRRQLEEAADMDNVLDAFSGVAKLPADVGSLEAAQPVTETQFAEFADRLLAKLYTFEEAPEFPGLVERLFRGLGEKLDFDIARKMSHALSVIATEKAKIKKKPAKKKAGKSLTLAKDSSNTRDFLDDPSLQKNNGDFGEDDFM